MQEEKQHKQSSGHRPSTVYGELSPLQPRRRLGYLRRAFIFRSLPAPTVGGGRDLKKDFHYQSSVHPLCPPPPDRSTRSFMRQLPANFCSFSAVFIMDGHLLRSVASTFRKTKWSAPPAQRHNKPIMLTVKWGGVYELLKG